MFTYVSLQCDVENTVFETENFGFPGVNSLSKFATVEGSFTSKGICGYPHRQLSESYLQFTCFTVSPHFHAEL